MDFLAAIVRLKQAPFIRRKQRENHHSIPIKKIQHYCHVNMNNEQCVWSKLKRERGENDENAKRN